MTNPVKYSEIKKRIQVLNKKNRDSTKSRQFQDRFPVYMRMNTMGIEYLR